MGDDLPKTYEWRNIRLTNYSYTTEMDDNEVIIDEEAVATPPHFTESSTGNHNKPQV